MIINIIGNIILKKLIFLRKNFVIFVLNITNGFNVKKISDSLEIMFELNKQLHVDKSIPIYFITTN